LNSEGDFNIELDVDRLNEGVNSVTIYAVNAKGAETRKRLALSFHRGREWPLPYKINWSGRSCLTDLVQVYDGHWAVSNAGIRPIQIGYDRIVGFGDINWRNYEISVEVVLNFFDTRAVIEQFPSNRAAFGIGLRWQGHDDWGDVIPRRGYFPFGALVFLDWNNNFEIFRIVPPAERHHTVRCKKVLELGRRYMLRARVESGFVRDSMYYAKLWPVGSAEPLDWDLQAPGLPGGLEKGSIQLIAHNTDVTFGNVDVTLAS
jgi:hypothetical protein